MPYFDHTKAEHLALLPLATRQSGVLADLAPQVEADVIGHFTAVPSTGWVSAEREATQVGDSDRYVFLAGYDADAALADEDLADALRRTIAHVLRWRVAQWRADPLTSSESSADGSKTVTYRADAGSAFPEDWDRLLVAFDTREPLWGLP